MSELTVARRIDHPEHLSISATRALARAFRHYYLDTRRPRFEGGTYRTWEDPPSGRTEFYWTLRLPAVPDAVPARPAEELAAHVILTPADITVEFSSLTPLDDPRRATVDALGDEILRNLLAFVESAKRSTLYLALSPYPPGPDDGREGGNEGLRRIFAGNTTNLFLLSILVLVPALFFFGLYAIVLMVAFQALALFYADRLTLRTGSVHPSPARPRVTVVGVSLPTGPDARPPARLPRAGPLRRELSAAIARAGPDGDPVAAALPVLRAAGLNCSAEDIEVSTRDPYPIVADLARRAGLPVPKVVVTDTPVSNAAATGISPGRSAMVITSGSLQELDDRQLAAVIGHEVGHIRGRDPILLWGTSAVLYLGALFLWPSVLLALGLFYFLLAFAIIYAVGKVLETRADSASVELLGQPEELASALTVVGFAEFTAEKRSPTGRLFAWLAPDPHPPVYFRIQRLMAMSSHADPGTHPFLASARDVAVGFFGAMVGRA